MAIKVGDRVVLCIGSLETGFGSIGTVIAKKDGQYHVQWDVPLSPYYSQVSAKSLWLEDSMPARMAVGMRKITQGPEER